MIDCFDGLDMKARYRNKDTFSRSKCEEVGTRRRLGVSSGTVTPLDEYILSSEDYKNDFKRATTQDCPPKTGAADPIGSNLQSDECIPCKEIYENALKLNKDSLNAKYMKFVAK